jgi:hypothetical protein
MNQKSQAVREHQPWTFVLARLWMLAAPGFALAATPPANPVPPSQIKEYEAEVPKTIVELQEFRETNSIQVRTKSGREGVATLINLNPTINAWYLYKVAWKDGSPELAVHLENPRTKERRIALDGKYQAGLVIVEGRNRYSCDLLDSGVLTGDEKRPQLTYQPLCDGRLYRRNPAKGSRSTLESATEFVRDQVWGGEKVIAAVHNLLADSHRETGEIKTQSAGKTTNGDKSANYPAAAQIDPKYANQLITSGNMGIEMEPNSAPVAGKVPGAWYPALGSPGVFVSMIRPNFVAPSILQSYRNIVNSLDSGEASALGYLVAFDLDQFEVGFKLGTDHPRVNWSAHIPEQMKNSALPGPDGIGTIAPLISTGLVGPDDARRTVATFTGGFKRAHGAFKYGEYSQKNHGSHSGFLENGVLFSKLRPGLSTLYILDDGLLGMKTWTEADDKLRPRVRFARQNGVPIIEYDETSKTSVPGRLVGKWGPGNWAGSEDAKLRTLRASVAIQRSGNKRFLIYAVFSDSTPSSMARVFQAYAVEYAMLLDMNALEHTYMALYRRSGSELTVDHLLKGMSVLEKSDAGRLVPRFIGYADNRDFFYIMRRSK